MTQRALIVVASIVACARAPSAPEPSPTALAAAPLPEAASSEGSTMTVTTSAASPSSSAAPTTIEDEPANPAKTYRSVLSVGDSFNGAFSLALEKRFHATGAAFARDVWVAVALSTFAREPRFAKLLEKHAPDLVIVNLGANDIDDHDPEAQASHVRRIVSLIGERDCYWVAPALWKKDTGIVDVLARSVAPCRFFDSKGFKVERRGDGWHPSVDGGAAWAERFWAFFQGEGRMRRSP